MIETVTKNNATKPSVVEMVSRPLRPVLLIRVGKNECTDHLLEGLTSNGSGQRTPISTFHFPFQSANAVITALHLLLHYVDKIAHY